MKKKNKKRLMNSRLEEGKKMYCRSLKLRDR